MQINQVVVSARPGDAVTASALELRRLLRQIGRSEIFARYVHEDLHHDVWELKDSDWLASEHPEEDLIVFHASIGEPAVERFLLGRPEALVVYYHNMSPPELFYEYDPALAGLLETGRRELARLASRAHMAIAVSAFNAAELNQLGYRDVRLAPLVIDTDRLASAPVPVELASRLSELNGPVLLFVGQLLPHKRVDFLLEMFHVLTTYHYRPATLAIIGNPRLPRLSDSLQRLIGELQLANVVMTGPVSDGELAGWYERADVFVTASEHEGFCVPPLEAMAHDVPVVARRFAALPETIGDAGVLVGPDAGPEEMAGAVVAVLDDASLRGRLIDRGRQRLANLDADSARAGLVGLLLEAVRSR